MEKGLSAEKVQCSGCKTAYVPDMFNDYYPNAGDNGGGLCEACFIRKALAKPAAVLVPNKQHVHNVCRLFSEAETCRFFAVDSDGSKCLKGSDMESVLPKNMVSKGDNCSGPPEFKTN